MDVLLLVHVLSAIIGIGPTFFAHVLTRPNMSVEQLKVITGLYKRLELFPKIGGSIAVLTGFLLFYLGDYGSITQVWIFGSITLYVLIQFIFLGFITPVYKNISAWIALPENEFLTGAPPEEIQRHMIIFNRYFYLVSSLGVLLFIFMIMKP
ncbi:DUF2269 family protein [Bacillus sp. BHET2]|uniref:DUF2269 family protein n=1 Tax=Bacillus sp. BHET2 TaxID=2583818 RepID=UPI00110EA6B4|nr:DUF2269 family protein [Bacillus sp. BHET2]TMU84820.1 DUF2269 family protein [Bacillus sp. BHET2]